MDTKVNYAIVGAFVIILSSCLVLSVLWLSAGFSIDAYANYEVFMQESVTGLSTDATVEYNGVAVGNVKTISINKQNPNVVDLLLSVKAQTPITQGTIAMLNTRGLTGITYIALKDKGDNLEPLHAVGNQRYPVIKTAPSFFLQLDTALTRLNQSVSRVSQSIQDLLEPGNLQSIKQILANMDRITTTIADNSQKLTYILNNASIASQQLPLFLKSSANTIDALKNQTLPETNRVLNNLGTITDNLAELSREIRQNPAILIRGKAPQVLGPGEHS